MPGQMPRIFAASMLLEHCSGMIKGARRDMGMGIGYVGIIRGRYY